LRLEPIRRTESSGDQQGNLIRQPVVDWYSSPIGHPYATFRDRPEQLADGGLVVDRNLLRVIGVYLPALHNLDTVGEIEGVREEGQGGILRVSGKLPQDVEEQRHVPSAPTAQSRT
jgi:hypothetical protein